ncbi:MAG: non-ribosomal peptide synthetase [Microcoleaceae cyanobacterium]
MTQSVSSTTLLPLTPIQQINWFLYQISPEELNDKVALAIQIHSPINHEKIRKAFQVLINRHSSLQTIYREYNGQVIQEICSEKRVDLQKVSCNHFSQIELSQHLLQLIKQPFNLAQDSPLRIHLVNSPEQDSILLLALHQLSGDWESLLILADELLTLYYSEAEDLEQCLPKLQANYKDWIQQQLDYLKSSQLPKSEDYWKKQLAGDLPILKLSSNTPLPTLRSYIGKTHTFSIDENLTQQLQQLATQLEVDLQILLLTAYKILLYQYTGEKDILVAQLLTCRNNLSKLVIGNCTNAIVLRDSINDDLSFSDIITQVSQTLKEAINHQSYPFSLLVQGLQVPGNSSHSPLSQAAFTYYEISHLKYILKLFEGLDSQQSLCQNQPEFKYFELLQRKVEFDFSLDCIFLKKSILVHFSYNQSLVSVQIAISFSQHFQNLLRSLVTSPEQSVNQLSILDKSERKQVLIEWNQTERNYDLSKTLQEWIEIKVEKVPELTAVIFEDQSLTYKELNQRANQLAHYLIKLGVKPETLVGICVERSVEMVVGLLGILKSGGAYIPLDPSYPIQRLAFMLEDTQVPLLLTQKKFVDQLPQHQAKVICLDIIWEILVQEPDINPIHKAIPENLAYVIYTSGSTGNPKGVMNTHRGVCNRLLWMQEEYQLGLTDRVLQKTPFSFDVSVWEFFWPLMTGAALVIAKPEGHQDSHYLVEIIVKWQITTLHFVPSMLQVFLEENLSQCKSLKRVICSGEALPFDLQTRFFTQLNCELYNLYGPTEAAIDVTFWRCQPNSLFNIVPIGFPVANTQIYILNSGLQPVPVGVPGELHIGGVQVARGYLNRPQLTIEKFVPNPFTKGSNFLYKTGDLVRYLPDGTIEYLNRIDSQVKIRGFRIELGEIEHRLTQHSQIREAVVAVRNNQSGEKLLVAYVVPTQELQVQDSAHDHLVTESLNPKLLRQFLKQKLPEYMVPSAFIILSSLPLTPNGKVDRRALPEPDLTNFKTEGQFIPPKNEVEHQLVKIWMELLGINTIGVRDNFFELGGHSLLALKLIGRIQQEFNHHFPLATFFTNPTIEDLSTLLRNPIEVLTESLSDSPLVSIQSQGQRDPFFCIHPAGGHVLCYAGLSHYLGSEQPFYGLQAQGFNTGETVLETVEEMASLYVKAIRSFKPEGPYKIGGWSFGGVVAYEVAQQLTHQGQVVNLLAIFDSYIPILLDKNKKIDDSYLVGVLSRVFGGMFGLDNLVNPDELEGLVLEEKINFIIEKARQAGIFPPEVEQQDNRRILDVLVGTLRATYAYQRQPYSSKVTVFRAQEKHVMASDPQLVWVELFSVLDAPEIEVVNVPGNHYSFILEPHVQVIAERLKPYLSAI